MTVVFYCPHCDFLMAAADVKIIDGDAWDPRCPYCNQPVQAEPAPALYDTLEEKRL